MADARDNMKVVVCAITVAGILLLSGVGCAIDGHQYINKFKIACVQSNGQWKHNDKGREECVR